MNPAPRIRLHLIRARTQGPHFQDLLRSAPGEEVWVVYLPGEDRLELPLPFQGHRTGILQPNSHATLPAHLEPLTPEALLEWIHQADVIGVWG